jgi:hypothetical protein
MYKAYDLTIGKTSEDSISRFSSIGKNILKDNQQLVKNSLNSFLTPDGVIDGAKMQEHWFPQVKADVFISHSHADENLATSLAGWLGSEFGLTSFIDSAIWGYALDLIKELDNAYCLNVDRQSYDYELRNQTTSHIYLMLAAALDKMIDRTECLFFINTPSSVRASEVKASTLSPWLYREITTATLIRRSKPEDHRELPKIAESSERTKSFAMQHDLPISELNRLGMKELYKWSYKYKGHRVKYALDILYDDN